MVELVTDQNIKQAEEKAKSGDPEAQYGVGKYFYDKGKYPEALEKFKLASAQGHLDASYMMGVYWQEGHLEPRNYNTAITHYKKAGTEGHANAQYALGYCNRKLANIAEAKMWYQKAIENQDSSVELRQRVTHELEKLNKILSSAASTAYASPKQSQSPVPDAKTPPTSAAQQSDSNLDQSGEFSMQGKSPTSSVQASSPTAANIFGINPQSPNSNPDHKRAQSAVSAAANAAVLPSSPPSMPKSDEKTSSKNLSPQHNRVQSLPSISISSAKTSQPESQRAGKSFSVASPRFSSSPEPVSPGSPRNDSIESEAFFNMIFNALNKKPQMVVPNRLKIKSASQLQRRGTMVLAMELVAEEKKIYANTDLQKQDVLPDKKLSAKEEKDKKAKKDVEEIKGFIIFLLVSAAYSKYSLDKLLKLIEVAKNNKEFGDAWRHLIVNKAIEGFISFANEAISANIPFSNLVVLELLGELFPLSKSEEHAREKHASSVINDWRGQGLENGSQFKTMIQNEGCSLLYRMVGAGANDMANYFLSIPIDISIPDNYGRGVLFKLFEVNNKFLENMKLLKTVLAKNLLRTLSNQQVVKDIIYLLNNKCYQAISEILLAYNELKNREMLTCNDLFRKLKDSISIGEKNIMIITQIQPTITDGMLNFRERFRDEKNVLSFDEFSSTKLHDLFALLKIYELIFPHAAYDNLNIKDYKIEIVGMQSWYILKDLREKLESYKTMFDGMTSSDEKARVMQIIKGNVDEFNNSFEYITNFAKKVRYLGVDSPNFSFHEVILKDSPRLLTRRQWEYLQPNDRNHAQLAERLIREINAINTILTSLKGMVNSFYKEPNAKIEFNNLVRIFEDYTVYVKHYEERYSKREAEEKDDAWRDTYIVIKNLPKYLQVKRDEVKKAIDDKQRFLLTINTKTQLDRYSKRLNEFKKIESKLNADFDTLRMELLPNRKGNKVQIQRNDWFDRMTKKQKEVNEKREQINELSLRFSQFMSIISHKADKTRSLIRRENNPLIRRGHDLLLMSLGNNEKFPYEDLLKRSKSNNNATILVKQGNRYRVFVSADGENWKVTNLDSGVYERFAESFPKQIGAMFLLRCDMNNNELYAEITSKREPLTLALLGGVYKYWLKIADAMLIDVNSLDSKLLALEEAKGNNKKLVEEQQRLEVEFKKINDQLSVARKQKDTEDRQIELLTEIKPIKNRLQEMLKQIDASKSSFNRLETELTAEFDVLKKKYLIDVTRTELLPGASKKEKLLYKFSWQAFNPTSKLKRWRDIGNSFQEMLDRAFIQINDFSAQLSQQAIFLMEDNTYTHSNRNDGDSKDMKIQQLTSKQESDVKAAEETNLTATDSKSTPASDNQSVSLLLLTDNKVDAKSSSPQVSNKLHAAVKQRALPDIKENYLEIDVPADGTCLFYSVMFSVLLPALNDKNNFAQRFNLLFANTVTAADAAENLRSLLQHYDGNPNFILDNASQLEVLVDVHFRQRVVSYMRSYKTDFSSFLSENADEYLSRMVKAKTWGDEPEIAAMSRLLQRRIKVYREESGVLTQTADHSLQQAETICLIYTGVMKDKEHGNTHYHFAIAPQHLKHLVMPPVNVDAKNNSSTPNLTPTATPSVVVTLAAHSAIFAAAPSNNKNTLLIDQKSANRPDTKKDNDKNKTEAATSAPPDLSLAQSHKNFEHLM